MNRRVPATTSHTGTSGTMSGRTAKRRTPVLPVLSAMLFAGLLVVPAASAATQTGQVGRHDDGVATQDHRDARSHQILKFDSMTPVVEPFVGATNPVRDLPGGGLPWQLNSAKGELSSTGKLEVRVSGLVLAQRDPVPPAQQGTNPIASLKAVVSCLSTNNGAAQTVNVSTDPAPATPTGNVEIEDTVELPSPCIAPIVFVTSPTGSWFAATGG